VSAQVADVIAGIRCVEIARIGELLVPMRAVAESERDEIDRLARLSLMVSLPGDPPEELLEDARWPFLVSRASLHPERLREGAFERLFTPTQVAAMTPHDVDALLSAQLRAQVRACPPLEDAGVKRMQAGLVAHAKASPWDVLRASGGTYLFF
jgi:hypothetical protein